MTQIMDSVSKSLADNGIVIDNNVLASSLSSFKIGGAIDIVAVPKTTKQLMYCVDAAESQGIKYTVIGRGSNLLFSDDGYRGLVIKTEGLRSIEYEQSQGDSVVITADCGVSLTALSMECSKKSLSGLEFAYGIPGSVGGAVYMNAGAYGGEMADVVTKALCYDISFRKLITLNGNELQFGYRKSVFSANRNLICLSATLRLKIGDSDEIISAMNSNKKSRKEKQPLEYPSAGSVFKRHPGYFIGKIIDEMGLKGYTIGGAQVSKKHAGFIVNTGNATSADVKTLIEFLTNRVCEAYGFRPECEIIMIE